MFLPNNAAAVKVWKLSCHARVWGAHDGVMVLAQRLWNEAVVVGVDDGGVEDTVDVEHARLLVKLVLDLGPCKAPAA